MTAVSSLARGDIRAAAAQIGAEVAAAHAADVDRNARFPHEAIDALRDARLLSCYIPTDAGGAAASLVEVASAVEELGRHCASTAMIFAMHQIQIASLVRHGRSSTLQDLISESAESQLLFGSATTEAGIGGDVRSSSCAVETTGDSFTLKKNAPVISYGAHS